MNTPLPTDRAAYRAAVAEIAAKASEKLPESLGRIASAVKLVLAGDVALLPSGGAMVASRSKASAEYHLVNGVCECADYPRAPGNLCAHRLAAVSANLLHGFEHLILQNARRGCLAGLAGAVETMATACRAASSTRHAAAQA
jgi:hypothetical protein